MVRDEEAFLSEVLLLNVLQSSIITSSQGVQGPEEVVQRSAHDGGAPGLQAPPARPPPRDAPLRPRELRGPAVHHEPLPAGQSRRELSRGNEPIGYPVPYSQELQSQRC